MALRCRGRGGGLQPQESSKTLCIPTIIFLCKGNPYVHRRMLKNRRLKLEAADALAASAPQTPPPKACAAAQLKERTPASPNLRYAQQLALERHQLVHTVLPEGERAGCRARDSAPGNWWWSWLSSAGRTVFV